jgi:DNA-binding CsgD family transcriptional regulator/tetratricopeptide (TPR) repeat protein
VSYHAVVPQSASSRKPPSSLVTELSPRQLDVLRLLAQGRANKEIGSALGISAETVRTHVTAVLEQLGVENRTEAAAAYLAFEGRSDRVERVFRRPAIAVLPLLLPDDDRCARTAGAGIARDLSDLFARWCCFPVIAIASTVDARTLGSTSRELGEHLGARFLIDGMLRATGPQWRLSITVVDAPSGHTLWTDAHEFPRAALFELQDTLCQAVVAAAYPRLVEAALPPRVSAPDDLEAWELAHEALVLQAERDRESNALAQSRFRAALAREPRLVLAHYGLGLAAYDEVLNQWGPHREALARLAASADRCRELAPHMAEGYYLAGRHFQTSGEHDKAVTPLAEAIGRNPSFASAHALLGQVYLLTGRADEGLTRMQHASRLSPRSFVAGLAVAHFARGEHREALDAAERAIATNPRYPFARAMAAACAYWLDEPAAAGGHARALLALQPTFTPRGFLRTFGADVDAVSRVVEALEALGAGDRLRGSS